MSLYLAHKFICDEELWFVQDYGFIVGMKEDRLLELELDLFKILDYKIYDLVHLID